MTCVMYSDLLFPVGTWVVALTEADLDRDRESSQQDIAVVEI